MKRVKDRFSGHSKIYQKYRPTYPPELYDEILTHVESRNCSWDCGTGNGQVASVLAKHFKRVFATDISKNQLKEAPTKKNIIYGLSRAESTAFKNDSFDLITVGQALHWFDLSAFFREVRRVSKHNGILAVWGYSLLQLGDPIDTLLSEFYYEKVGPYWDNERQHIDSGYQTIKFDFVKVRHRELFEIKGNMDLETLEGYLNSWSSVQNYIRQKRENPVPPFIKAIQSYWKKGEIKSVRFPVFIKIGRITK